MALRTVIVLPIPKYERLQRMAERYPSLNLTAIETHITLLKVADEILEAIEVNLARHGLSQGRFIILVTLLEYYPEPLSHSILAELCGVTKGNITGLVDGLERDGCVKRGNSSEDRRITPISLTRHGLQRIESILPDHLDRLANCMGELSVEERKILVSLLLKVRTGLPTFKRE